MVRRSPPFVDPVRTRAPDRRAAKRSTVSAACAHQLDPSISTYLLLVRSGVRYSQCQGSLRFGFRNPYLGACLASQMNASEFANTTLPFAVKSTAVANEWGATAAVAGWHSVGGRRKMSYNEMPQFIRRWLIHDAFER